MVQITDFKRQNKEALKWILDIHDLRKSYFESFSMFSVLAAVCDDGLPKGSGTSNPCMNKAMTLIELEKRKGWIMAIEAMEQTLSEKTRKFLELRRDAEHQPHVKQERGRPSWVPFVQNRYASWFNYRFGCDSYPSERTMTSWMSNIIDVTVRIAIDKGCFR